MESGWVCPGKAPRNPIEWQTVTPLDQMSVSSTDATNPDKLLEIDTRGWDKLGLRVVASGLESGDTVVVQLESPDGASYESISMVATLTTSNQSVAGVTAAPVEIQSPKYVVTAYFTSGGTSTTVNVFVLAYLKGKGSGCK